MHSGSMPNTSTTPPAGPPMAGPSVNRKTNDWQPNRPHVCQSGPKISAGPQYQCSSPARGPCRNQNARPT
eukprot:4865229-Lingulodinium_polyedra.AAC.1